METDDLQNAIRLITSVIADGDSEYQPANLHLLSLFSILGGREAESVLECVSKEFRTVEATSFDSSNRKELIFLIQLQSYKEIKN